MKYVIHEGTNKTIIIALHGTGGTANDLVTVARYLDPQANYVGLKGEVMENGMARYFKREADGTFNLKSLKENTQDLHETIQKIQTQYPISEYEYIVIGYSNGANLFINYLREYNEVSINKAFLYHPSLGNYTKKIKPQCSNFEVLLTTGLNDPYINQEEFNTLINQLKEMDIVVHTLTHKNGHQLLQVELEASKDLL